MYTQCEKCKAIFRVNMREVTVAKGKLRCGECNTIFNATKSLSTTIPESYQDLEDKQTDNDIVDVHKEIIQAQHKERVIQSSPTEFLVKETKSNKIGKWSIIGASLLALSLMAQVAYNKRHVILGTPIHEPEKIQMLNHNIFAHPNESNILLISAQIENTAEKAQPYPVLELSLKDAQSNLVAFRRFLPKEYLTDYSDEQLIPAKVPITLKLKIKDPGNKATRFQFEFL
jgi:predicted Zn finger-like uncharacterized protein